MSVTIINRDSELGLTQKKLEGLKKYSEIIQYGRKNPAWFTETFLGVTFMDYQKYTFMSSWDKQFVLWLMCRNGGKALALDTKIPTPNGVKTIEELEVGDYVFNEKGESVKVVNTSDIFLNHECYEVIFEDGEKIIADSNHLWEVSDNRSRKWKEQGVPFVLNTEELYNKGVYRDRKDGKGREYYYRVPMAKPIQYSKKSLDIDPYVLGVWLGDGNSRDTRITSHKDDFEEMNKNIVECGYTTSINYNGRNNCYSINVGYVGKGKINKFKIALKKNNLIKNKYIPNKYLEGSIEQRLALLQGLMDTDGSCYEKRCAFSQKDHTFILQFEKLLSSLGIKYNTREKKTKCNGKEFKSYEVSFYTDLGKPCFRLSRKYNLLPSKLHKRMDRKSIIAINKVDSVPTKCIMVDSERRLFLCGDKCTVTHNSTLSAPFVMAKMMLYPNFASYILSLTAMQSQDTFLKMENIAKRQIESFAGLTDIFIGEVVGASNHDGFIHHPQGFRCKLYNGSFVQTVSGDSDNSRGKRSNLNLYDESGFLSDEYIETSSGFCLQDSSFKLGGGINTDLIPDNIPNQLLLCSSASDTDSNFYHKYAEWGKRMFMGDPEYFVASLDCEVIIGATLNGVTLSVPLLSRDKVDSALRTNPAKASREYLNKFDNDGGDGFPIKRSTIAHNSSIRVPMLSNVDNTKRRFAIGYDPAHDYDNSAVAVGEYIYDKNVGWKLLIQNVVNFRQLGDHKKKKNIRTPEQIEELKDMLVKYNGKGFADYENIDYLFIDAGSGGGGNQIADYFMEDWTDRYGVKHRGLIDRIECESYSSQFPNAVDKLKLIQPKKYRTEMFDDFIELLNLGLIEFTEDYDLKGHLNIPEENDKEIIEEVDEETGEIKKVKGLSYKTHKLSWEEEISLKNIDIAKEELIATMKYGGESGSTYRYGLSPEKKNKIHDDRAYAIVMLAWHLKNLRREHITNREVEDTDSQLVWF